ncbi:unnamed protein product [Rotaria sordida]|uniref:VLIG-type G domain-containing protein n=1 Tax=Rotaria sordida TaxID=392033 RepID=A0A814XFJ2_9BILA|nr:unnamed protein product [Rotaria sordida]CAF1497926.1 unnamed protein product [Rotaria sordida]
MPALDWKSLINHDPRLSTSSDELASNIRQILDLINSKSSEIPVFTTDDYTILGNAARRALDPTLLKVLNENNCNDSNFVLKLVEIFITNIDDLACFIVSEEQIDGISSTILNRLKGKLECRGQLLKLGLTSEKTLLDKITTNYLTLVSFKSMSYQRLNEYCREIIHDDHKEILEKLWVKGNDLREKVQKYNLPLEITDQFRKHNILAINDLTEQNMQLIISELSDKVTDEHEKSRLNRIKANLKRLYREESDEQKTEIKKKETVCAKRLKRTEEAIQLVTKMLNNLKDNSSSTSTSVKDCMKLISEKLEIPEWKLSENELNEPNEIFDQILKELNSVKNLDLKTKEYSDEELIARISGGTVLYGVSFIDPERLGEKATRPLLRQPEYCSLNLPELPFKMTYHKFTSIDASNQFEKIVKTCGYTVAANLSASKWGFHLDGELNIVTKNSVEQYEQDSKLSTDIFLTYYSFLPMKSFRIPIEEMRLSKESETFARSINNLKLAKKFLNDFNSHVSTGINHLGGIYLCTISITTDSLSSVDNLEKIGVNHFNTAIGAGFQKLNIGGSISYESFDDIGEHTQSVHKNKQAKVKSHISCYGPPCTNRDLFSQIINTHSSTWHLIDRSDLKSLVPVWELMKDHTDPYVREAAKFIKRAWLEQALKYSHIPVIDCEIKRVMLDAWNPSMIEINLPVQQFISKREKNNYHDAVISLENMLEKDFFSLPINDNHNGEEIAKIIRTICHSVYNANLTVGFNLLPTILVRDKMKSFLHTVAIICANDSEKLRLVVPALQHLLSSETILRLQEHSIYLDEIIKNLIQKVQQFQETQESREFDTDNLLISTSVTMLNDLPTKLRNMHAINTENESILAHKMVQIIKLSLIKGESVSQQQLGVSKQLENMLTDQHGWTNDGFITEPLTHEGIKAVIKDIEDKLNEIQNLSVNVMQQPTEAQEKSRTDSSTMYLTNTSTSNDAEQEKYSHLDWIIDRPVRNIQIDPVAGFIDRLRHRMKLDAFCPRSSVAMSVADEDQQLLDEWSSNVDANQADQEQRSTTDNQNQFFYDIENSSTQLNSLTDTLVYLTNNSKLTSKIELFRLLIDRRYAIPIITTNINRKYKQPFQYHVDVLKFIPLPSIDHKISYLDDNKNLYRIAIVSRKSIAESETSHLISKTFGSHSTHELQRSDNTQLIMAEIADGYIDDQNDTKWSFLILHVVGDYTKLRSFICEFTNLVIIEQDPSIKQVSEISTTTFSSIPVIIWNVSQKNVRPKREHQHYVLTGTINGIVKNLQAACMTRLKNFKGNSNSLSSINNIELFYRPILSKINVLAVIRSQDYSTLRQEKLLLQKSFNIESKYRIELNRLKNDYSEQRAFQHKIREQEQNRQVSMSDIEKLDIIKIFINILQHPNFDQRMVAINELINGIDDYSASVVHDVRRKRDEAFHAYQQAVRQKTDGDFYKAKFVEAKAIYAATIVSIEHLWRECSQLYSCDPERYFYYPELAAQYLIDGFPIELLDGDAGIICDKWIRAVLNSLNSVQSSGKSTLLNIMFGVRFRSSAGQCTRGVNIQLIKVENRDAYDYILLMDTEGLRAPELKDLEQAAWKDNRMATFAVLPADATIILVNGEQDETLKDVLPIVMLAYQQSQLAENYGNQLASMMLFVYSRVDVKQIDYLIPNVQELFRSLTTSFQSLQYFINLNGSNQMECTLFRDFRLDINHHNDGDIRFLGNIKNKDGTIDTDYGIAVTKLREYIHSRVTSSQTVSGWKWTARTLNDFAEFIGTVWRCIISSDFNLTFSSAIERKAYDQLDTLLAEATHNYASIYNLAYESIEREIIRDTETGNYVAQEHGDHEKEKIVRQKIDIYFNKLNTSINEKLKIIDDKFIESLDDPRWQQWKISRLDSWKQFKHKQVNHWKEIISEKLHSIYLFDTIVGQYQRRLRVQIKNFFQGTDSYKNQSLNVNELKTLFESLFDKILNEAREKHRPVPIEKVTTDVYKNNTAGKRWDLKRNYMDLQIYAELNSEVGKFEFVKRKIWNLVGRSTEQEKESELLSELLIEINEQLKSVKCYSYHIVQDAITRTNKKLNESKLRSDKLEGKAHNLIYDFLIKRLTEIQNKWNQSNNIVVRLESEKNRLYEFFLNASKGIAGAQLLTSEIINILKEHSINAYKKAVIKHVVLILQNERFVKCGKVIQANADLHLIELIKKDQIDELIKRLEASAEHYTFILNRLIQEKLVDTLKSQWLLFVKLLKNNISSSAAQAQAGETHRTQLFIDKLRELLPTYFVEQMISLDATVFIACDDENKNVFNEIQFNIIQCIDDFDCPTFTEEQIKDMIESIRSAMVDRQHNNSAKMRCGILCPTCKVPCHLDAGHIISSDKLEDEKKPETTKMVYLALRALRKHRRDQHDAWHQPGGLAGRYWKIHPTQVNEIVAPSCSMSVRDGHSFWHNNQWNEYKKFNKVFPEWSLPSCEDNHRLKLREYIFYRYHKDLAHYYGRLPCTEVPFEYNHNLDSIEKELLSMVKDI